MLLTSLLIGLAGGMHCGLMCAPLQTAFLGKQKLNLSILLFQFGRILTYVILGLSMFFFGKGIALVGLQEIFIYLICLYILYFYVIPKEWKTIKFIAKAESIPFQIFKRLFSNTKSKNRNLLKFSAGILNGLLPCGLVYIAVANSLLAPNIYYNIIAMLIFGLSTLPWLIGSSLLLKLPLHFLKHKLGKFKPLLATGIIVLLLIRVVNIPFIHTKHEKTTEKGAIEIPLCGGESKSFNN